MREQRPRSHSRSQSSVIPAHAGIRRWRRSRRGLLPRLRIALSRYPRKGVVLAVGIRIKLPGVTQEQFDAAHDHINPDRSPWPGMLFHSSGPIDGGWGVIDFWESRADFDAHLESDIQPGIAASGVQMQGPPDIKEFPVHEIIHP